MTAVAAVDRPEELLAAVEGHALPLLRLRRDAPLVSVVDPTDDVARAPELAPDGGAVVDLFEARGRVCLVDLAHLLEHRTWRGAEQPGHHVDLADIALNQSLA